MNQINETSSGKIREDFPILNTNESLSYLDNAATTHMPPYKFKRPCLIILTRTTAAHIGGARINYLFKRRMLMMPLEKKYVPLLTLVV